MSGDPNYFVPKTEGHREARISGLLYRTVDATTTATPESKPGLNSRSKNSADPKETNEIDKASEKFFRMLSAYFRHPAVSSPPTACTVTQNQVVFV